VASCKNVYAGFKEAVRILPFPVDIKAMRIVLDNSYFKALLFETRYGCLDQGGFPAAAVSADTYYR
jgi:hypothetical protein